jgi:predicted  nucleic acid-binding Zn-ribbon protein
MLQRALRRLPVALLIAVSGYLQTASAVRYTIDFQGNPVDQGKCKCFFGLLENYGLWRSEDCWNDFNSKIAKLSVENKDEEDLRDIVFRNGSITKEVSEEFSQNICVKSLNSFTFENFKGELNLNPELQRRTETIRLENCEFTITENCFRYTKNFKPNGSRLLLENGCFHIPENMERWCGNARIILPKKAELANNTTLEAPLSIPFNAAVWVLGQGVSLGYVYGHTEFEEFSSIRTKNEELHKKLESVCTKHKAEIEKLQRELDKEKAKRNSSVDSLQEEIKKIANTSRKRKEELEQKDSEMTTLQETLSVVQNKLEATKDEKEKCEGKNIALEEKICKLESKCKSFKSSKSKLNAQIENLQGLNSKLEETNKKLEKENTELKEKIDNQNETVAISKQNGKKYDDLEKEIKQLRENSEEKSDKLNEILQQVKTKDKEISKWKKMYATVINWMKYAHNLITVDLKKNAPGMTNILHTKGYGTEIERLKSAIKKIENGDFKKKDKKGQWIDLDEIFGQKVDNNEQEEDEEDEIVWRSEATYRGRGQRSRGRGGYYRGYNRGRRGGQLMENRGRGGY